MNLIKTAISVLTIVAAMVVVAGVGWSAEGDAPPVDPSWRAALVRHLQQYERYRSWGEVVQLSCTVDRSGWSRINTVGPAFTRILGVPLVTAVAMKTE